MQLELKILSETEALLENEEWKEVANFPRYEVSTMGRFRRKATGQFLGGTTVHNGYLHIGLFKDNRLSNLEWVTRSQNSKHAHSKAH